MATPAAPKPFRLGIIGAGGIAHAHIASIKKVAGVEVVAVADISEKALASMKEKFGVRTYADFKEMLAKEKDLDAVSVCTPNGLHAENTIAALQAGRHVIVEKPMAMSAKEGQAMVDAAKKAGKQLVVGFQYRFDGKTQVIKRQIDSGVFGKPLYVRCQALRRRGIPNWGVFGRKDLQGGGPMIDIGVHVMEMAHFVLGSPRPIAASGNVWTYLGDKPMEALTGWANWDYKSYTVEDLAVGLIRFDNGAMLSIEASFAAHIEKDVWNFTLMGEKGGASWDPCMIFKDEHGYMFNETPAYVGSENIFDAKMRHFVEVCRDGATNISTGEQGLAVQKMLNGVYDSAAKGGEVAL